METPTLALLPNNKSKFNPQIAWASLLPGSGSCTNGPSTLSGISWPHTKKEDGGGNKCWDGGVGWWDGAAGLPLDVFGQVLSHGSFGKQSLSTQPVEMDPLDPI